MFKIIWLVNETKACQNINQLESGFTEITQNSNLWQNSVSGCKKLQKLKIWKTKFSENMPNCCPWKPANFLYDNRKANCSLLAVGIFEKLLGHFTNEELQREDLCELVIIVGLGDGWSLSLRARTQNLCLFTFRASVSFFNRLYRIHLHFQDLRQQKIHFLPYYPSPRESSPLNLIISEEKFGHLSAISATSFPGSFLYFEKVPWLRLVTCVLGFCRFQKNNWRERQDSERFFPARELILSPVGSGIC